MNLPWKLNVMVKSKAYLIFLSDLLLKYVAKKFRIAIKKVSTFRKSQERLCDHFRNRFSILLTTFQISGKL